MKTSNLTKILSMLAVLLMPIIALAEPGDGSLVEQIKVGDDAVVRKIKDSKTDFVTSFRVATNSKLRIETSADQIHCGPNPYSNYTIENNDTNEVKLTVTCYDGNFGSVRDEFINGYGKQFNPREMLLNNSSEMTFFIDAKFIIDNDIVIDMRHGQTWGVFYNDRHVGVKEWHKERWRMDNRIVIVLVDPDEKIAIVPSDEPTPRTIDIMRINQKRGDDI